MPVSAVKQKLYPGGSLRSKEWRAIRDRILQRAGNHCELCGVADRELGGRTPDGQWYKAQPTGDNGLGLTWPDPGQSHWCGPQPYKHHLRIVRIVLTIMHLDHDTAHNDDANLKAGCQRCHNRHDSAFRRANSRKRQLGELGQMELLL